MKKTKYQSKLYNGISWGEAKDHISKRLTSKTHQSKKKYTRKH